MDRSIPTSSKLISNRIQDRNRHIHLLKLNSIKSTVNSEPPKHFDHLKTNKKKNKIAEEQLTKINRENQRLLDKVNNDTKSGYISPRSALEVINKGSLNRNQRINDLIRISVENQNIMQRLGSKKSTYNIQAWDDDAKKHDVYLRNISEYPVVLNEWKDKTSVVTLNDLSKC